MVNPAVYSRHNLKTQVLSLIKSGSMISALCSRFFALQMGKLLAGHVAVVTTAKSAVITGSSSCCLLLAREIYTHCMMTWLGNVYNEAGMLSLVLHRPY